MTKVSWLHLSDLQIGPRGSRWLQADVREEFERDLRRLHERSGPWQMVLISGDLTLTGSEREFELLNAALESFWRYLHSLGSDPVLLAVPGNHDRMQLSQRPLESGRLVAWHSDLQVQEAFWADPNDPLRQSLHRSFETFSTWAAHWRGAHPLPPSFSLREGVLPGDFVSELVRGKTRVRVVGLNSAFLPLGKGDLAIDPRQIAHDAPAGKRAGPWPSNELTLLLTHHPLSWLHPAARDRIARWLASEGEPTLHLCGSLNEGETSFVPVAAGALMTLQAPSLFANTAAERQPQGYVAASVEFDRGKGQGRIWLRGATKFFAGGLALVPAGEGSFALNDLKLGGRLPAPGSAPRRTAPVSPALSKIAASPPPLGGPPSVAPTSELWSLADDNTSEAVGLKELRRQSQPVAPPSRRFVANAMRGSSASSAPRSASVDGLRLRAILDHGHRVITKLAWSPNGSCLATSTSSGPLAVYELATRGLLWSLDDHRGKVVALAWSPNGKILGSCSERHFFAWHALQGNLIIARKVPDAGVACFGWSPDSTLIAFSHRDGGVSVLDAKTWEIAFRHNFAGGPISSLAWSPDGLSLVMGDSEASFLRIAREASGEWSTESVKWHDGAVFDLGFRPKSTQLASASRDRTIRIWDVSTRHLVAVLEGHTDAVVGVSFLFDGRLLASKGRDDTVRFWSTESWEQVAVIQEVASLLGSAGIAFSPFEPVLATLGDSGRGIRLWDVDTDALLRTAPSVATVHSLSAKVVLVGEGNAGKSCLALRLAEDRYEELSSTHGMRFWSLPAERLDPQVTAPSGERREIILWDMGGQSEYRLIHQLFLRDTAVALLLLEPRRGEAALEEIDGWNTRFQAQMGDGRPARKLLVGTKLDDPGAPLDQAAIDALASRLGFEAYLSTSAREGRGIDALKRALLSAIDWAALGQTSRPELFQSMRREIELLRRARRVVLMFTELEDIVRQSDPERFDPEALRAVVKQLAMQGVVADTRLADGARALVLEVEQVERYAGSLIVLARENPRGVPAIDLSTLLSPTTSFPRIGPAERLRRDQELVVLDCVIELLLEHGLCFRHEGLLIFPSLFPPSPAGPGATLPHAISLYYDFSGAVDNIYASLVASLAMSRRFGHPRLWEDRAEFGRAGEGAAGVRKVERRGDAARGIAHLDVYFDAHAPVSARDLFVSFIEEHLRAHGVEIYERLQITCACGETFAENAVRRRIVEGQPDIGCPACDRRTPITPGAREAKARNPALARELRALRTTVEEGKVMSVGEAKVSLSQAGKAERMNQPIRVLHLSDLHVTSDVDVKALLQPLGADLRDREEGLGVEGLDYLVISGDITNRASPAEFERARELVSSLIGEFGLTAERCIIVPGNHDLDWGETVYTWKRKREVDAQRLAPGSFKAVGDEGYIVRDDTRYPERFKNFSQHF